MAYYAHPHHNRCSKWMYKSPKNSPVLLKNLLFEALFPWWRSFVFQMLIRYFGYLSSIPYSSFFKSWHTYTNFHSNKSSKWMLKSSKRECSFAKKCSLWRYFSVMKVTCMPIVCFIFWVFTVSVFFFSFYVAAYVCICIIFYWKCSFWSAVSKMNVDFM